MPLKEFSTQIGPTDEEIGLLGHLFNLNFLIFRR